MHILSNYNISLNNLVFDTMLGAYVLNPTKESYGFDDLAQEYLGEVFQVKKKYWEKGKIKITCGFRRK